MKDLIVEFEKARTFVYVTNELKSSNINQALDYPRLVNWNLTESKVKERLEDYINETLVQKGVKNDVEFFKPEFIKPEKMIVNGKEELAADHSLLVPLVGREALLTVVLTGGKMWVIGVRSPDLMEVKNNPFSDVQYL